MKNFYEATITKPKLAISLKLEPIGQPVITCWLSGKEIFSGTLTDSMALDLTHALCEPITLEVKLKDKIYSLEKETAVLIQSFTIDNLEVLPKYCNYGKYTNDHYFNEPTIYLGFNGSWKLQIYDNFYHWYHNISGQGWLLHPTR